MRMFFFIASLWLSSPASALEAGMCVLKPGITTSGLDKLDETLNPMLKLTQIEYAQKNMSDFCRRNLMLRYLNSQKIAPPTCLTMPMEDLENLVNNFGSIKKTNPWEDALRSTRYSRFHNFAAIEMMLKYSGDFKNINGSNNTLENLKQTFKNEKTIISQLIIDAKVLAICGRENKNNIQTCLKALNFIEKNAAPSGSEKLMTPKAWLTLYQDNKYNEGLQKLALKLKAHIQKDDLFLSNLTLKDKIAGKKYFFPPKENIWDDLIKSFTDSGLSLEEAQEGAWSTLAVISNGGPNTKERAISIEKSQKSFNLSYISMALGAMDYLKQDKGLPLYSFPTNIKTSCDSAKYYHFWMAAYLSRELVKNNIVGIDEAIKASFLSHKAYQFNREIGNAGKNAFNVLKAEPYGPIHQVVRMDLAYAASGAAFGAKSSKELYKGELKIDDVIISLLKDSGSIDKNRSQFSTTLDDMSEWEKVFAPDTALNFFLKP